MAGVMMDEQFFSLGQAAVRIGIAPYRITYAITNGMVPDARMRIAGKRAFTEEEVKNIARHFRVESSYDGETVPEAEER